MGYYQKLWISILICFLGLPLLCVAEVDKPGTTVHGYVYSGTYKETLSGVHVKAEGSSSGTFTNNYGYYSITVPQLPAVLVFSHVGYQSRQVFLDADAEPRLDVWLDDNLLNEVQVHGTRNIQDVPLMSMISLPVAQLQNTPSLMGEKDLFKVLQLMPGVQGGNEGASGLYVRGGGNDQNLVILDDALVYNVSHLFGVFSLFNGDAIKSVQLYKGGFPARYGGRISSVVDIGMKDGSLEKYSGNLGLGLISSSFAVDGPIQKGKSSFLVSGRRTYHDFWMKRVMDEREALGYYFYDFNLKANWIYNETNRLYLSGYFGRDKMSNNDYDQYVKNQNGLQWQNALITLRWNRLYNGAFFTNASLIFSEYGSSIFALKRYVNVPGRYRMDYTSGVRDLSGKYDFHYQAGARHTLRFGAAFTWHHFRPAGVTINNDFTGSNWQNSFDLDALESGIYFEDEFSYGKWTMNTGLRLSHYFSNQKNYLRPEPRINIALLLNSSTSLKASFARMNQYVHLSSNTGVGMPTNFWLPSTDQLLPQSSDQYAFGVASSLKKNLELTVEAFYKTADQVLTYSDNASYLIFDPVNTSDPFVDWEKNMHQGDARSMGLEFMLHRKTGRWNGWIAYTLSDAQNRFSEINNGQWYKASFHRMHDVSVVTSFDLNKRITMGATWVYHSGRLITLPTQSSWGYFPTTQSDFPFDIGESRLALDYYTDRNNWKSKDYHRLDLSFQFKKQKRYGLRTWEIGVYNAYNRMNPFNYSIKTDYKTGKRTLTQRTLLPLVPSVTYRYKF